MAIAGVLLTIPNEFKDLVAAQLKSRADVVEISPTPMDAKISGLAIVLECKGSALTKILEELANLPHVLDLGLTYADYTDDFESAPIDH